MASLVAQIVKNLPVVWETQAQSLVKEGPLEKEMATHSSILAQRIPWIEEPGGLQSLGLQRVRHNGANNTFTVLSCMAIFGVLSRFSKINPFVYLSKSTRDCPEHVHSSLNLGSFSRIHACNSTALLPPEGLNFHRTIRKCVCATSM